MDLARRHLGSYVLHRLHRSVDDDHLFGGFVCGLSLYLEEVSQVMDRVADVDLQSPDFVQGLAGDDVGADDLGLDRDGQ